MVDARWPDGLNRRSEILVLKMAHGRRKFYEDQNARISILARALCPETGYVDADRSDHLAETLADGAGHTFLNASMAPSA